MSKMYTWGQWWVAIKFLMRANGYEIQALHMISNDIESAIQRDKENIKYIRKKVEETRARNQFNDHIEGE